MKAPVIYESMYGNTHAIARSIAQGMEPAAVPDVLSVEEAGDKDPRNVDLLVVGGPTHIHGLSRKAVPDVALQDAAEHPGKGPVPDPSASGPGLREWFDALEKHSGKAAAFDTRAEGPELLTDRASKTMPGNSACTASNFLPSRPASWSARTTACCPADRNAPSSWTGNWPRHSHDRRANHALRDGSDADSSASNMAVPRQAGAPRVRSGITWNNLSLG